jgi:hypothetical protein
MNLIEPTAFISLEAAMKKPYETPNLLPAIKEKIMAITDAENEDELIDEFDNIDEYMDEQEREKKAGFASWAISLALHGLAVLILSFVVIFTQIQVDKVPTRVAHIPPPQEIPDPPREVDFEEIEIVVHTEEVTSEETIITDLDIPVEEISTEETEVSEVSEARGRAETISDSEMGNTGAFAAIGAGGGNKGAFGRVTGGDRRAIGRAFGPNGRAVTTIIDRALIWLMRHQSPNGMWDSDNYHLNCDDDPKGEPGRDVNGADEALTGYAVLCFLGAGYDHKTPNRFRRVVKRGIDWLVTQQDASGLIGRRNYEHPVAAMALAEAYAMTMDPNLREPAQKAIDVILERQVQDGDSYPLGWDYVSPRLSRMDSSVTVWNIFALKSAKVGGLDVGQGLEGSRRWLEGAWKAANPNWEQLDDPYTDTSVFPYTWNATNDSTKKDHLSFAGGCAAVFLGHGSGDIMLETLANDLEQRFINNGKWIENTYCLYYSSLFLFQMGNERWTNFMNRYTPYLIENFITDEGAGCKEGTWNFANQKWHGSDTSPVLHHVYALLSMEVAIRYERALE